MRRHARRFLYLGYRSLLWLIFMLSTVVAQAPKQDDTKIVGRVTNQSRIIRNWDAMKPEIDIWNREMKAAGIIYAERFNPKLVAANPDERRRQNVAHVKATREAVLKVLDALNELIDEDDW